MSIQNGIRDIVGRRIAHVVVREQPSPGQPERQVFLVFDDDTHFEFYGSRTGMHTGSRVYAGGMVYVRKCPPPLQIVREV